MGPLVKNISVVTLLAIAMALLESAVVIYLREIMYPEGFRFPLAPVLPHLLLTEILREAATLVVLVCIGLLAGKRFSEKFAWFIYSFAVWDIFYYVFLWLLLGWPESLMTWDVLFLIPATWTGPVVTPLILTVIMILFAWFILSAAEKGRNTRIEGVEWVGLSAGSGIVVAAFMTDYLKHMLKAFAPGELLRAGDPRIMEIAQQYVPESFPWLLFTAGILVILAAVIRFRSRV
jgi:ribose/xylose/arabinose/galactoside ABC-type transport system permease subunit